MGKHANSREFPIDIAVRHNGEELVANYHVHDSWTPMINPSSRMYWLDQPVDSVGHAVALAEEAVPNRPVRNVWFRVRPGDWVTVIGDPPKPPGEMK